jgi:hypothetical protein
MKRQKHHDYPIEVIFDWNPSHIIIPLDWTPAQAETAAAILNLIEEKIWTLFGDAIIEMEQRERVYLSTVDDSALTNSLGDDIPF